VSWVWIETDSGSQLVEQKVVEDAKPHRARSEVYDVPQVAQISKGVAHISRSLPKWTPGAGNYTEKGEPIIEGLRDVASIEKANPHLQYNRDAFEEADASASAGDPDYYKKSKKERTTG
jgi:hypothetical protein